MEIFPFLSFSIWVIAKWFVVFGLALYVVFAFVIVKQVKVMTTTLELGFTLPVKVVAYLHLLFALGLIFLAVIIL